MDRVRKQRASFSVGLSAHHEGRSEGRHAAPSPFSPPGLASAGPPADTCPAAASSRPTPRGGSPRCGRGSATTASPPVRPPRRSASRRRARRLPLCGRAGALGLAAASAPAATATTGKESFSGYIGAVGTKTDRKVVGSVVVAKGVYDGVGKIVERPNRPGDSARVTRDDLV